MRVTEAKALAVAKALFPGDVADGSDCRAMIGREGLPCLVCAERNEQWAARVAEVRAVLVEVFK